MKQVALLQDLQRLGFQTPRFGEIARADLAAFYDAKKAERGALDVDVDGIVLSVPTREELADLGFAVEGSRRCPVGQIALKYPAESGVAIVTDIQWSTDGAAHLGPVAIYEPLDMQGAQLTRASFKSSRWMTSRAERVSYFRKRLQKTDGLTAAEATALAEEYAGTEEVVGVGSVIEIARSGDVIPTIKRVVSNYVGDARKPSHCPCCKSDVIENGAFLDCSNDGCPAKEAARMVNFLSALKVLGLAQDTLVRYANAGVTLLDFLQADDFAGLEAKLVAAGDISMKVWQKVRVQLEAA